MAQSAMKEMKMKKRVALEIRFFAIVSGMEAPELVFFGWSLIHSHQLRKQKCSYNIKKSSNIQYTNGNIV